jgi:tRNA U34 5-methylaminomethyl-2-thiouridine-forming methyltransferase MnmC
MRFHLHNTATGPTVFDSEAGECFKSRHSANEESDAVFLQPGILEHPRFGVSKNFRVLELGFGLGTNFLHLNSKKFPVEYLGIERDFSGLAFYLQEFPDPQLELFYTKKTFHQSSFSARLIEGDFFSVLESLPEKYDCIFFDPFSPKANPECWQEKLFSLCYQILNPEGRLVTYSVSRIAKDSAQTAGFQLQKRKLPEGLQKRSSLLAIKPAHP